jgi:hypothetical protein
MHGTSPSSAAAMQQIAVSLKFPISNHIAIAMVYSLANTENGWQIILAEARGVKPFIGLRIYFAGAECSVCD